MTQAVRAPGRVNLIGEHTDYNEGFVLPVAISLETRLSYEPRGDRVVELTSMGETRSFSLDELEGSSGWARYAAGAAWGLREAGIAVRGFSGVTESSVPAGAGLSSSAAFELACALALVEDDEPDPSRLALACHRGDNGFVGVRSGVMDQLASALGRAGHALLIDCRSLDVETVKIPDDWVVVVCDTGVRRDLAVSAYNERRAECEQAAAILGLPSLRDATIDGVRTLPAPLRRRAEHVVRENFRTLAVAQAMRSEELRGVRALMAESHRSLRELYEVSSAELDALVEAASIAPGVIGARMTGAGFGGCTVNLVERGAVPRFVREMEPVARAVYQVDAVAGATRL